MSAPDEPVGYKQPPKHHQFKKGQSGNPQGRPRGHRNFASDVQAELQELIRVTEGQKVHTITKQRTLVKRTMEQALKGDLRAIEVMTKWYQRYLAEEGQEEDFTDVSPTDRAILQRALQQMREAHEAPSHPGGAA
ncbi:DUF5681 domain-containing protein [Candidatus Nitrospira neomarina]|uniref:DUF5681 domain-containing protein n=1 Tax=Candidatus Nitrospira neomarina TaxID=3020899 RepID=A0AA96GPU1_9BACT|nr:DUF5681 domain-containing protein [Candidatus Nitrospira neomarina]WNM63153.1 DUF5681 domain-containing protein [Candidatus Nitrospira neomarina]